MNPNLLAILLLSVGGILLYSSIKNKDPRDVIKEALGASKTPAAKTPTNPSGSPLSADEQYNDPRNPV